MDVETASSWLVNHSAEVGKHYNDFMKKHGHRCVNEVNKSI